MNLLFPLIYLRLENAAGKLVIRRDLVAWLLVSIALAMPCIVFESVNYFHKDGLVDKVGTFSSVLIGFYVAALIAVATLNSSFIDLDRKIEVGVVRRPSTKDGVQGGELSRREYVCYMFGYMAFVSLFVSLTSLIVVAVAPIVTPFFIHLKISSYSHTYSHHCLRAGLIIGYSIILASLAITTVRGLYYLMDRIYYAPPQVDQSRDLNGQ